MSSNRIASLGVLAMGVVLGYFAAGGFYQVSQESVTNLELPAHAMDAACSTASPGTATCEMPGEISRADYFRLEFTANEVKYFPQETLQAVPATSAGNQTKHGSANIVDRPTEGIGVESEPHSTSPILVKPVQAGN